MDMRLIPEARPEKSTNVRPKSAPPSASLRALKAGLGALGAVTPAAAAAIAEQLFLTPKRRPRPAAEHDALAAARHVLVPSEHGPLAAWEWGDHGPRVLLVHGWEGRGAQLAPIAEALVAVGARALAFDAPAHGSSPGRFASIVHFASAIEAMADAYGPFEAIVAHSMGGPSTTWALTRRALARRVVMICPPIDVRDFTAQLSRTLGLSDEIRAGVEARLTHRLGVSPAALHVEALAPRMKVPLLVIHDEDDREVSIRCGERIAAHWPGGRLSRTRGLGHRRVLRDPAVIEQTVAFALDRKEP